MATEIAKGEVFSSQPRLARAVAVNTLWGSGGRLAGGIFAFVTLALLTRSLGPEHYGAYATVLAFFFLFNALADGGLYNILSRDIAREERKPERLIAAAFTLRVGLLAAALILGFFVFAAIPGYQPFLVYAPLAIVSYAALSLGQLLMAVFQRHFVVWRATFAEIAARIAQFILVALLFLRDVESVVWFLGVLAFVSVLQFILLFRGASRYVPITFGATRREASVLLRDALPVAVGLVFTLIYFRLDTVLLSLMKSPQEVGIYNLSYKLLEQLIFFPAMFLGVFTPVLSRAFVSNRERFLSLFHRGAAVIAMGALPVFAGGWFLAAPLVLLLGGGAFLAAIEPLRVLLIATALIFFGTLLGTAVIVAGLQRRAIAIYAAGMAVNLAGNLLFIPAYSYMGAAWATVATELIIDAGLAWVLFRNGIRFAVPRFARIAAAAGVMALPLAVFGKALFVQLGAWSLLPFLVVCPIVYGAALIAFRAVSREDLNLLWRKAPISHSPN